MQKDATSILSQRHIFTPEENENVDDELLALTPLIFIFQILLYGLCYAMHTFVVMPLVEITRRQPMWSYHTFAVGGGKTKIRTVSQRRSVRCPSRCANEPPKMQNVEYRASELHVSNHTEETCDPT